MARFLSVDPSTNSFAFAEWEGKDLVSYGKINFTGANALEKACDAALKVNALIHQLDVTHIVIESTIFASSASVAITLGVAQGAMIGAIRLAGVSKIYNVAPLTWQVYIGNKAFTKAEKLQIRKDYPGKSASWYKAFERKIRKQKTMDVVNKTYKLDIDDNDVGDAIGLGIYAHSAMFALRTTEPKAPPTRKRQPTVKPAKRTYTRKKI